MQPTFCSTCVRVHSRVVKMQLFETKGREMGRPNGRTGGSRVRALLCWGGLLCSPAHCRARPSIHPILGKADVTFLIPFPALLHSANAMAASLVGTGKEEGITWVGRF